jgi:hypothetical protein
MRRCVDTGGFRTDVFCAGLLEMLLEFLEVLCGVCAAWWRCCGAREGTC